MITMRSLGKKGRLGNHLLKYASLREIAFRTGSTFATPAWSGEELFDLPPTPVMGFFPVRSWSHVWESFPYPNYSKQGYDFSWAKNCDLFGDAMPQTSFYNSERFRSYFPFKAALEESYRKILDPITQGKRLVVVHMRLGDFSQEGIFSSTPVEWIVQFLKTILRPNDLLYIASDEPEKARKILSAYKTHFVDLPEASLRLDFYIMTRADLFVASRSTLSLVAAMLNRKGQDFYWPSWDKQGIAAFDPWNCYPYRIEEVRPHPPLLSTARALRWANASYRLARDYVESRQLLNQILTSTDNVQTMIELLRKLGIWDRDRRLFIMLAEYLFSRGRFEDTVKICDYAFPVACGIPSYHRVFGEALNQLGFSDRARQELEIARMLPRHSPERKFLRAAGAPYFYQPT